jgi:hypothetical protein
MHTIYTAGYSGWQSAQLAAQVQEFGAALWDIRFSPLSRRPEWRQAELRAAIGPAYVHVKALGNVNYKGGPIELYRPAGAIEAARRVLAERPVILLCACKDWRGCHRLIAAELLAGWLGAQVQHLEPPARPAQAKQVPLC